MEKFFHAGVSNAVSATFLALLVACVARLLARRPAVLHCLWFLVLLKLVTPPLYEVAIPWPSTWAGDTGAPRTSQLAVLEVSGRASKDTIDLTNARFEVLGELEVIEEDQETALTTAALEAQTAARTATLPAPIDLNRVLALIWIGGTVTILVVSIRRIRRFRRLLENAHPASEEDQDWVNAMARRMGLRRGPIVEWIWGKLSPMIWSLGWRSRLIVPRDLWTSLDERQRSTLVVHELAHLRRGDHYVRFFELVVTSLFWWHPVVWWVRHSLRDAEEQCCDAWVVWAFPDAARSYAETLLEAIDFLQGSQKAEPSLASGFGKVHHLRRRLTMIMTGTTSRLLGFRGALALLGLGTFLLPMNATWAQKTEDPEKVEVVVKSVNDLTYAPQVLDIGSDETLTLIADKGETVGDGNREIHLVVKVDNSPEIQLAGSLKQVLDQLEKQIAKIKNQSPQTEQDEKRWTALNKVVSQLTDITGEVKGVAIRPKKPGERREVKDMMLETRVDAAPKKPQTEAQKAEIDKARSRVKELSHELEAKAKELSEARASLAKLEGTSEHARIFLRHAELKGDGVVSFVPRIAGAHELHEEVVIDRRETSVSDEKSPKHVEIKKVGPIQRRVVVRLNPDEKPNKPVEIKKDEPQARRIELKIGSGVGLVKGEELVIQTDHPNRPEVKVPAEQQRIDELEKRLKALLDEVASLKKEKSKSPSRSEQGERR